jgi:DNA-binding transcriptional LysR family regulator
MDIRDLDLNLLLVLDTLIEEGNLTRTAQRLRVSQPTISVGLAKLRAALGDELFIRVNGNIMRPTARALALQPIVANIIKSIRLDVLSLASFDPAAETGVFTLSLSDIGELEFLPRLLERLEREAPHASLRSVVRRPVDLALAMDLGEIDLAIGYFPDIVSTAFKQQTLFRHRSACLVRRGHPSIGEEMTLDDYLAARHIAIAPEGRTHEVVDIGLAAQGLKRRISLETGHFLSVPFLLQQSDLVATLPRPLAIQFAGICNLLVVEPPFTTPLIEVKQLWHKRFDGHPRLRWLRRIVAETSQNRPSLGKDAPPSPAPKAAENAAEPRVETEVAVH